MKFFARSTRHFVLALEEFSSLGVDFIHMSAFTANGAS